MLSALPWFRQARSFLVPLRSWENAPDAGLEGEGQGWSLLSRTVDLKEVTAATSPDPIGFLPDPCALQSTHRVILPPYSTWRCWKIGLSGYQIAHLRDLRAPGKVNLAGRDSEPAAALPPGRAMEPPRRRARSPEKPTSAPGPRRLSADIQTQARSFPGQRPGQVSTQVSMSQCTEQGQV